jgi:hypothetical protein
MPDVIDNQGVVVYSGRSDAECARWWRANGDDFDMLDTGEMMINLYEELELD